MIQKNYNILESFDFDAQDPAYIEDYIENRIEFYNEEKLFKKFSKFMSDYVMPYVVENELDMITIGDWTITLPIPIETSDLLLCIDKEDHISFYLNSQGFCLDFYVNEYDVIDTYDELETEEEKKEFKKFLIEVLTYDGEIMKRIGYHNNKIHESFDFDSEDIGIETSLNDQIESYNVNRFKDSLMDLVSLLKKFFEISRYNRSWIWHRDDLLIQILGSCKDFIENPKYFKISNHNDRIFFKILPDDIVIASSIKSDTTNPITLDILKKWKPRVDEIKALLKFGIERSKKGGFKEAIENIVKTIYNLAKKNPHYLTKYGSLKTEIYDVNEYLKTWRPHEDTLLGIEEIWIVNPSKYEIRGKIGRLDSEYSLTGPWYFVNPIDFDYYYNNIMSVLK